jgi:hypothetical protein
MAKNVLNEAWDAIGKSSPPALSGVPRRPIFEGTQGRRQVTIGGVRLNREERQRMHRM